jgi:hypothetical protein
MAAKLHPLVAFLAPVDISSFDTVSNFLSNRLLSINNPREGTNREQGLAAHRSIIIMSRQTPRTRATLVKNRVGQTKTSTRDLPPQDHAFGLEVGRDQEGAGEGACAL